MKIKRITTHVNNCKGDCERNFFQAFPIHSPKDVPSGNTRMFFHFSPKRESSNTKVQGIQPQITVRKLYHIGFSCDP